MQFHNRLTYLHVIEFAHGNERTARAKSEPPVHKGDLGASSP